MDCAGLIFDDSLHYLDHLAPFCSLARCPLIVCEPEIFEKARLFYPDLEVKYIPIWDLKIPKYTIACDGEALLQAAFPHQSTKVLWLPHGNSDKPFFQGNLGEVAFVYGQRMVDFMNASGVFPNTIRVGNFRWEYFCKYSRLSGDPQKNSFLYAPTWDDFQNHNSFWRAFPLLAASLPKQTDLSVKLHPNTVKKFSPEIEVLKGKYSNRRNIHFLPDAPPIYPLLAKYEGFIGDMSSIGYDFLAFERPMYFLNANAHLPLHQCGMPIDPNSFSFELINPFSKAQQKLYQYTFDSKTRWQEELYALCRS